MVVKWYDARGEYSENRIKELKIGFSMERMPSSYFKANAVFFRIGCLAYNLFRIFQLNGSLYFSLLISTYFLVKNTLFQKSIADFGVKQWKNLRKNIIFIRLDHILYGVLIVEILKLKIF